jgi:hypothetical protein
MSADQIKFTRFSNDFWNSHDPDAAGNKVSRVEVTKVSGGPQNFLAYVYRCLMVEDNDGAPTCYGLDNPQGQVSPAWPKGTNPQMGLTPLERGHGQAAGLANATLNALLWSGQVLWVGLYAATPAVAAANGLRIDTRAALKSTIPGNDGVVGKFPVVQDSGYYVSTTGQPANAAANPWEQSRYHNAAEVPYAVHADLWDTMNSGVGVGDRGFAINNSTGASSEFSFLDTGTPNHVGESSRKLCRTLVPTPDSVIYVPNTDYISFIVFPNSRAGGGVGAQIEKLAAADNSDELPLFLALDADYDRFKAWLRRFYASNDYHSVGFPSNAFLKMLMALSGKGYPVDGVFHAVEKSINVD